MEIKLCYKTYPFKISLAACKAFYDSTGEDLQNILMKYIIVYNETHKQSLISRMSALLDVVSFETAAVAIHSLIRTENKSIPLDEVRDGMFICSWLPNENDDDLSEPWVMVMVSIATEVNEYFENNIKLKKKAIDTQESQN